MTLVSGPLSTVTTVASAVTQVEISINTPRTTGAGLMTAEQKIVAVTGGNFSSPIAPGNAAIALIIAGRKSAPIPILVDDVGSQTLAEVVDAARLATGYSAENLAQFVHQVLGARHDVLDAVAGFGQVEDVVTRMTALEAMSGLSPESPVDGQTANLLAQPDSLTHDAVTELTTELTAAMIASSQKMPGFVGHFAETAPTSTNIDGLPVIWFKEITNFIPEIISLTVSANGLSVTITTVAEDPDGQNLTTSYDWGDGQITDEPSHTYSTPGSKTIRVTVTDEYGASASSDATIYVADPIPSRWGYEAFSRPDNTVLAGWLDTTTQSPTEAFEEGNLTWRPGDQSTGGAQISQKAYAIGGAFRQGTPDGTSAGSQIGVATVDLPESTYRVQFRYEITPGDTRDSQSRVGLYFSCSPVSARNTTGTTSLAIRLTDGLTMDIFTQSNGTFSKIEGVGGIPRRGLIEASLDAEGNVIIKINGQQKWAGVYSGAKYPKIGIDVRGLSMIDDFEVGAL